MGWGDVRSLMKQIFLEYVRSLHISHVSCFPHCSLVDTVNNFKASLVPQSLSVCPGIMT